MARSPTVTVLLPAYNAAAWLKTALASIFNQSFRDFELLVMDDGSTDTTAQILSRYSDPRMRVVREARNRGLVDVLNHGIELARGKFLARMDADDIAHPRRLELQAAFLERHLEIGVCGTWFRTTQGSRRISIRPPTEHDDITAHLFFRSPFGHPTVMIRRDFLEKSGLRYDVSARHAEDFDLWVRARPWVRFANLPSFLLEYRSHPEQVSSGHLDTQRQSAARIRLRQLASMLPQASAEEQAFHLRVCDDDAFSGTAELLAARDWLDELGEANRKLGMFSATSFGKALAHTWFGCCARAAVPPRQVLAVYFGRRYGGGRLSRLREHAVLAYRTLRHALSG